MHGKQRNLQTRMAKTLSISNRMTWEAGQSWTRVWVLMFGIVMMTYGLAEVLPLPSLAQPEIQSDFRTGNRKYVILRWVPPQ